jgi:hypothetical protein
MSFLAGLWGRRGAGDPDPDLPHADTVAIAGYGRLADKEVIARLPRLSQEELTAVETYERAHDDRPVVLHKLRYLRGDEPVPGYDDLAPEDVPAALAGADLVTLDLVRSYEQRLRGRERVLGDVERLRRERRAGDRAAARPAVR